MNKKILILAVIILFILWRLVSTIAIPGISDCHLSDLAGAGQHCHWVWEELHIH